MSNEKRIERSRDEALFEEVFTDEEHDHASDSARDGLDHIEAASIVKDYVSPKRTVRAKDRKRKGESESGEPQSSEQEKTDDDAPESVSSSEAGKSGKSTRSENSQRCKTPVQAGRATKTIRVAVRSVVDELANEDDTETLSGMQGGYRIATRIGAQATAKSARTGASSTDRYSKAHSKEKKRIGRTANKPRTGTAAPSPSAQPTGAMIRKAANPKMAGFAAKIAAAVSAAFPGAAAALAVAATIATICAVVVAILSFSWLWDDANKKKTTVDLPPGCEALRSDVEDICKEVFGNADWSDMVLAIMAAESGGDLNVVAAGGATYVYCAGGCGTPLSSVRQDVMQASECGYGGVIVHGATKGEGIACCPSVGSWPYSSITASTARASIYAGTLYLRDGIEMWGSYLGGIGVEDVGKLALVAQGYNYNMSSWFAWCKARGITEYSLEASEQFQETLPAGFKGTANHAEKVMAYYPYGHGSTGGNEDQATLALIASAHATNDIYYQQFCAKWTNDMYELVFGSGTCSRYSSAWDDWCANGVSSNMEDVPLGAAVYGSGWGYPGMGNANPYGHVGIYIGDGKVADYSGVHDLRSWASQQNAICNGHIGWLGWGWLSGDDLTKH